VYKIYWWKDEETSDDNLSGHEDQTN